jgi:DNA-binding NarL/FixJ family response regulator
MTNILSERRILIVEDDFLLASHVSNMVEKLGGAVIGPARRLAQGVALADSKQVAGAILDINLGDEQSYDLADKLLAGGVFVIFATASDARQIPERFSKIPVLCKPLNACAIESAFLELFGGQESNSAPSVGP